MATPFLFGAPPAAAPATPFAFGTGAPNTTTTATASAFGFHASQGAAPSVFSLGGQGQPAAQVGGPFQAQPAVQVATPFGAQPQAQPAWQTKVGELSDQWRAEVFKVFACIKQQEGMASDIGQALEGKNAQVQSLEQIGQALGEVLGRLQVVLSSVHVAAGSLASLKEEASRESKHAESAVYILQRISALSQTSQNIVAGSRSRLSYQYFCDVVNRQEAAIESLLRRLDDIERTIRTEQSGASLGADVTLQQSLHNIHNLFLFVSSQVASSHDMVIRLIDLIRKSRQQQ